GVPNSLGRVRLPGRLEARRPVQRDECPPREIVEERAVAALAPLVLEPVVVEWPLQQVRQVIGWYVGLWGRWLGGRVCTERPTNKEDQSRCAQDYAGE